MNKPFSLYIHIPFCKSKCPYCDFYSARPEEDDVFDRYLAALCARLAVYGEKYGERLLHTVYFGGGTPSFYGAARLIELLDAVNTGSGKLRGNLWYSVGRYVYVPLAVILCCVALFMHVAF